MRKPLVEFKCSIASEFILLITTTEQVQGMESTPKSNPMDLVTPISLLKGGQVQLRMATLSQEQVMVLSLEMIRVFIMQVMGQKLMLRH